MKKRYISFIMTLCMLLSIFSTSVIAADKNVRVPVQYASSKEYIAEVLNIAEDATTDNNDNLSAVYAYKIFGSVSKDRYKVEVNGAIEYKDKKFPYQAEGIVDAVKLKSGKKFIQGPLRGSIEISGEKLEITVGFRKMSDSEDISCGVTIYPNETSSFTETAFFSFGNFVKSWDLVDEIKNSKKSHSKVDKNDDHLIDTSVTYSYEGYDYASFKTSSLSTQSGNGQKIRTYWDTTVKKIRVDLFSYSNAFDDSDFPSVPTGEFIEAGVSEFRVGLETNGDGYIAGIDDPGNGLSTYVGTTSYLEDVFLDILGAFEIPAWTIAAMFDDARGQVDVGNWSNHRYVNVAVNATDIIDLDDGNFKIAFQLNNTTTNDTTYYAYSEMEYVIDCLGAAFYVDTYDTYESVNMPF